MAFVKRETQQVQKLPQFDSNEEAIAYFERTEDFDEQRHAVTYLGESKEGARYLVEQIRAQRVAKEVMDQITAVLAKMDRTKAPIEAVMELLKHQNAYIRNLGISVLRDYGEAIEYYIVKFLIGDDRDLRIFALNVLGDVAFAESRNMMLELLESEEDINVAMTAVDYLAEIGQEEDIPLLEAVKERFSSEFYAAFAVDNAIRMIKG